MIEYDFPSPVGAITASDLETYRTVPRAADPVTVFPQSVASGDPSPRGAILWTRIAPSAYERGIPLIVEVTDDESFEESTQQRVVEATEITPDHDYTAKVDLDESNLDLGADRRYYYRFEYDGVTSQTGRFRTLPDGESTPDSIRFAVVTCQNYLNGYFGAYHHVAQEDIDFLLDLGDFIYEYAGESDYEGRSIMLPSGRDEAHDIDDYRHLYRTYRSDPFLQRALERHTRIHIWDDHEFANDIYWDYEVDAPRAPQHPLNGHPKDMHQLVRDALKAWWEYTPARLEYDPDANHLHDRLSANRSFRFGTLLTLVMTDERLHKTKPELNCARTRLPDWLPICYVARDSDETMFGDTQREWFLDEVRNSESIWTAWANEVLTLPARVGVGPFSVYLNHQAWDGYESEREELMHRIKYADVENFVTLTGDMHSYLAGYQQLNYPSWIQNLVTVVTPSIEQSRRVGVELMTPAMTSVNIREKLGEQLVGKGGFGGKQFGNVFASVLSTVTRRLMPHIEFFDSSKWGYSVVEFTPAECRHLTYSVDKSTNSPTAEKSLLRAVRVPTGRIEIEDVTESVGSDRSPRREPPIGEERSVDEPRNGRTASAPTEAKDE